LFDILGTDPIANGPAIGPMGLLAVGRVPFRPIGKSHYTPAPWDVVGDLDYLPAVMSDTAMRKGLQKAMEPIRSYNPIQKARMKHFLSGKMRPIWFGDLVKNCADVVADLNMKKSAGWPFYYQCDDKEDCLAKFSIEVWDLVERVLRGEYVPMYFSATLKDELRTKDRVAEEKTRVFNASGIVHLICSKILFSKQNEAIVATRGMHPSTLGISVPGPEFVTAMLGLQRNCEEGDVSGCDLRLNLDCAEIVRDVRKQSLPAEFHDAVDRLYDATYAGHSITEGVIYRLLHNKSGTENTISDTFLILWMQLWEAINTLRPDLDFDEAVRLLINGDDLATGIDAEGFGLKQVSDYLKQYGTILEIVHSEKGGPEDITFLSNSLRWRYVPKYGDILVAAGNKSKLVASENFVKSSPELTFEESCLVHLLGLRVCLWPFAFEFEDIEDRINGYLKDLESRGQLTERIRHFLRARISEEQILSLHVRTEDGLVLFPDSTCEEAHKLLSLISSFTEHLDTMSTKQKKPNAAERAAQSARDKAVNAAKSRKGGKTAKSIEGGPPAGPKASKAYNSSEVTTMVGSAGIGETVRYSSGERSITHPRHGRGLVVSGRTILTQIVLASGATVPGQVFFNWDVNPLNVLGSRLAVLAGTHEKYRFKSMQFEFEHEQPTSQAGKVFLAYDADPMDPTPAPSLASLQSFLENACSKSGSVFMPFSCRYLEKEDNLFFTNEVVGVDPRLVYQGQLYFGQSGLTDLANKNLGNIVFSYECELFKPALEQVGASAITAVTTNPGTVRTNNSGANQLFNGIFDPTAIPITQTLGGGAQWVKDALNNWGLQLPPGNYSVDLNLAEKGFTSSTASNVAAPTFSAILPVNAPSGGKAPTYTSLIPALFNLNANASGNTPIFSTSQAGILKAPSGALLQATVGALSGIGIPSNAASGAIELAVNRLFGAQAGV